MPLSPATRSRRDSWPPTQVRINPTLGLDDVDEDMEQNPMAYFLSPAPSVEDMDFDDDLMEFDAGIEDLNHPREIVRSVSPSSLEGLSKPPAGKGKKSSPEPPDLSDGGASPYEDDSDEEYIRFGSNHSFQLPFSLRDFTIDGIKAKPVRSATAPAIPTRSSSAGKALASPDGSLFLSPSANILARGRSPARGRGRGQTRSLSARRRPQHLWREPSPDVWSIEEETEEDIQSDMGSSIIARSDIADEDVPKQDDELPHPMDTEEHLEVPAAKPKKKVRFVLPVKE